MSSSRQHVVEPNLTPFIDVLLVLLIIFMVLNVTRRTFDLQVPTRAASTGSGELPIVLEVGPGGWYRINRMRVTAAELHARLVAVYARRPTKVLFIKGSPNARYQEVITAVDIARGAGVSVIGVVPRE